MKIAVVGTGAIGGITAGLLKRAGEDVRVVCKYPELAERITTKGLHLMGVRGDFHAIMPAVATVPELEPGLDLVLLATKATDMLEAARDLLPKLSDESLVVSLQNGICEDAIANVVGRQRTIGCVVGWGGTMIEPGELEMTSTGEFVIGNIDNHPDPRLPPLAQLLSNVVPVQISDDIVASLYSKLIINACITSLGAVCGLMLGDMLARKTVRDLFIAIMREAVNVADAIGLKLPPYGGKLDYYQVVQNTAFRRLKAHLLIRIIGLKYRRLKSSSLQSLERGKPTEIDYLNGYIVERGAEFGIATPINSAVVAQIKQVESGQRPIAPANLDELVGLLPA